MQCSGTGELLWTAWKTKTPRWNGICFINKNIRDDRSMQQMQLQWSLLLFVFSRALELSLALVSAANIRLMMKELLIFLSTSPVELRSHTASGIFNAAERYHQSIRLHIEYHLVKVHMYVDHFSVYHSYCMPSTLCKTKAWHPAQLMSDSFVVFLCDPFSVKPAKVILLGLTILYMNPLSYSVKNITLISLILTE